MPTEVFIGVDVCTPAVFEAKHLTLFSTSTKS
jgi:hypothetical protein